MRRHPDAAPGALIRLHRQAAGLTQRQLAETARVSIGVVRDLEQGLTGRPRAETVRRLAAALGLDQHKSGQLLAAPGGRQPAPVADNGPPGLRISVLGPVTAWRDGSFVPLGPAPQRAVLGLLALNANTALHREALIDALWADTPPPTAVAMIQSYVSRLRRLLDPAWPQRTRGPDSPDSPDRDGPGLITTGTSYRLGVTGTELDAAEFGQLASRARDAHAAGELALACQLYARAIGLWQGRPLADLPVLADHPAVLDAGHQHADAVLGYADAAFAAGWYSRVLRPLRTLHRREPLNERVAAILMIALAGSSCQAEALGVYEAVRQRLDDQLGVYPCAELSATQAMVLRQQLPAAASGEWPTLPTMPPGRGSRRRPAPFRVLRGGADGA